ncbi:uncharacterized protein LOC123005396 [Tribolium madens]|uniref:uncharacterized protein LOC123005396 n=1 Tax=Tribolium madens TaxID=41895 RepID=UPI001CF74C85|nr:uncharacterized protein LOC123005396 [Tribolium madens]
MAEDEIADEVITDTDEPNNEPPQESPNEEEEEDIPEDVEEGAGYPPPPPQPPKNKTWCNTRIDELSTPNKRIFLALWNEHAYHLPKEKVKNLKELLQQLYAMSPEETAKYFAELRAEAKAAAMRKKLKQKLRKYLQEKHHQKQRQKAYKLFKRLLKCGISYAVANPVPPLVSIRLRYLSDIILEQLCVLRKVNIPSRENPDKLGNFLISVADWMAIAVERLYYAAQLSINEIICQDYQDQFLDSTTYDDFTYSLNPTVDAGQPIGTSTPKGSLDMGQPVAASTPKGSLNFGQPVGTSTPKGSLNFTKPKGTSTPKGSRDLAKPTPGNTYQQAITGTPAKNQTERNTHQQPYYSMLANETTQFTTPKTKSKVPYYTFSDMRTTTGEKTMMGDKTLLEMPPYGFKNVASGRNNTVGGSAKKQPKSDTKRLNKTK